MKPLTLTAALLAAVALATQAQPARAAHGSMGSTRVTVGLGATFHGGHVPAHRVHGVGCGCGACRHHHPHHGYPRMYRPFPGHPPVVVPFPGHPPVVHPPIYPRRLYYPYRSFRYFGPGFHIRFGY